MVRNIVVLGGSSHPQLVHVVCTRLQITPADVHLAKFSCGETSVEIKESVRGKDVYIIQSGGGKVNDTFMELLVAISACKTASAQKVTAVLPIFPYSRQSDVPYRAYAPLSKSPGQTSKADSLYAAQSEPSTPSTPHPDHGHSQGFSNGLDRLNKTLSKAHLEDSNISANSTNCTSSARYSDYVNGQRQRSDTSDSGKSTTSRHLHGSSSGNGVDQAGHHHDNSSPAMVYKFTPFQPQSGYRQWVAQAGTLVADLLTCAGADHIITMDLHDAQYQGFFDIPVDNLYGRALLKKYIQYEIPDYQSAVIVSPDAGGAKRATAIADKLGIPFALIHKVQDRRPSKVMDGSSSSMMLVGDVANRVTILIDDLADTAMTITRAAKLLKNEGSSKVYALLTHGLLSGDAIEKINASAIDKIVVTNSVPQHEHEARCPKLEVLEIGHIFAEAIRRVHHGESISVLFSYD